MVDIDQIQADVDFVENDPDNFWAIVRAVWRLYLAVPGLLAEVRLLRHRLHKWEEWKPDDETLAGLKEQASGARSHAAATVYIGALEWYLRKAAADSMPGEDRLTRPYLRAVLLLRAILQCPPLGGMYDEEARMVPGMLTRDIRAFLKDQE